MKLTAETIATLDAPADKAETFVWDETVPGFGLRLRRQRNASRWIFQYRHGRQQRRITIGALTAVSPTQARKTAAELHAKVRLGQDPAGAVSQERARAAETFGALLKPYLEFKRGQLAPRSFAATEYHLVRQAKSLHALPIAKLDRRAVASLKADIASTSGNVTANRAHATVRAFLSWCMQQGVLEHNVALGMTHYPERSRTRVLAGDELKTIWAATSGSDHYSAVVRLLMLTACRRNEIGELRWSEIVDDKILLPADRTKNGRAHVVPLSLAARDILAKVPARPNRDFIFGRMHHTPLRGWQKLKAALDKRIAESGAKLAPWTHHDIRRTVATRMAEIGIMPHAIEAVLNHLSGSKAGVAGIYNRSTYEREKAAALSLWAEHLVALVEGCGQRIVPLGA
jgi:integrase